MLPDHCCISLPNSFLISSPLRRPPPTLQGITDPAARARISGMLSEVQGLPHVSQVVSDIGRTGNAGSTPCHLHFEIHVGGRPVDPEPYLRAWDRYS